MMSQKGKIALLFAVVFFYFCASGQADALTIAEDGVAKAVIVVSPDSPEPERHAATEIGEFLKQITGAKFETTFGFVSGKSRILVGLKAAKLAIPNFSRKGLGSDGIVIRTIGNDLILAGGEPRGTLYAVYTFLEDHLGCRWWSSKVSRIPKKPTLKVGKLNIRYVPPLEYRESFWFDAFDGDWAVRNKCNGNSER
ncbi:MAG: alpha-glucuronidase family glycosyl hydrolase, partial [Sedimentisphaerales bacterium]